MLMPSTLLRASVEAGMRAMQPPPAPSDPHLESTADPRNPANELVVPIRALGPAHRERIAQHLLALDSHDRYLRFGFAANDEQVRRYTDNLSFSRDEIYGIYNRKLELVATAHLAFSNDPKCQSCAEFGVSVLKTHRGRGYGARLFERALMHARNEGIDMLFIHALSENAPMLSIAKKHGATLERHGAETEAFLRLPPADWESRVEEFVEEKVGQIDYELKLQAKQFWEVLGAIQDIRRALPNRE